MTSQRLERELQQTIQLNHKNLLPFLGTTQDFGPLPAIVTPWMRNGSLTMFLERNFQQLTIIRKLQIVRVYFRGVVFILTFYHSSMVSLQLFNIVRSPHECLSCKLTCYSAL